MRLALCSHPAHLLANPVFVHRSGVLGTSSGGKGSCSHAAQLSAAVKRWRGPMCQGSCSHTADLWASRDTVPCFERCTTNHTKTIGPKIDSYPPTSIQ